MLLLAPFWGTRFSIIAEVVTSAMCAEAMGWVVLKVATRVFSSHRRRPKARYIRLGRA